MDSVADETLEKSRNFINISCGQEIIAQGHVSDSTTHILFMLRFGESKKQHEMVPTVFHPTLSLVDEGL